MRARRQNESHRGIAGLEQRAARMRAQAFDERAIRGADAAVDLQGAEPEIEQHRGAVLRTQRFGVRADFASAPRARSSRWPSRAGRTPRAGSSLAWRSFRMRPAAGPDARAAGCRRAASRRHTTFRHAECRPAHRRHARTPRSRRTCRGSIARPRRRALPRSRSKAPAISLPYQATASRPPTNQMLLCDIAVSTCE